MSEELSNLYKSLLQVLDEAMQIDGATRGNIHLANPVDGGLQMVVHRGFNPSFVQTFAHMRADEPTSCARAIRYRRRVIISDIARDLLFGPYLTICRENGFQAVQSTPIIGEDGLIKGVFSTHFPKAHHLSEKASMALDDCASKMARLIVEHEKGSVRVTRAAPKGADDQRSTSEAPGSVHFLRGEPPPSGQESARP